MMGALTIPDAYAVALVVAMLGFVGWIARELFRTSQTLSRLDERSQDHERRLAELERDRGRT